MKRRSHAQKKIDTEVYIHGKDLTSEREQRKDRNFVVITNTHTNTHAESSHLQIPIVGIMNANHIQPWLGRSV